MSESTIIAGSVGILLVTITVVGMYMFRYEFAGRRRPTPEEEAVTKEEKSMNWAEFDANERVAFTLEIVERRRKEALSTRGANQLQWLASKVFPMMRGKSIDAVFLVSLFLLQFSLRVMQDREDAGVTPT